MIAIVMLKEKRNRHDHVYFFFLKDLSIDTKKKKNSDSVGTTHQNVFTGKQSTFTFPSKLSLFIT